MACFGPLTAWQTDSGDIVFAERGKIRRELRLPCGQCIGCRLERSRQWAVRCMHENQMHEFSSFVTLTFDDENIPTNYSLDYSIFQRFMKRLRDQLGPCRFFMCGEYGEQFSRPHFHACLFGVFFPDRELFRSLDSGSNIYTSKTLERLWPYGFSSVGDVTFESAAYVARYVMKKVTGPSADEHYLWMDYATGELVTREPEFCHMSLKPGIGFSWYEKYKREVYPNDRVVLRGVKMKPPKYYDKLLQNDPTLMSDAVEYSRYVKSLEIPYEENTERRLRVREQVTRARLNQLRRKEI